ncbi:MAG: aminopeptidase [Reichenbachiella sp.]|uniref:aminopeptidase n=1 Tax=Reichenbachiella sp. TaxID=2184521 RepID=UPI00326618B1
MKQFLKKTFAAGLIVLLFIGLIKHDLISYLLMQARGQLNVLWNARTIDAVLTDETVDAELKTKIEFVREVKLFAEKELGLKSDGLYTTIYDQNGKDILWNLSASKPYVLESVEWYFPIVGSVSYKGFFDLERAKSEEQLLKKEGYDTRIRPVNAWSTLGWFSDPILSKNLERSKGSIAELFIHEITHANIFIKDSLTFNENLASFIGEQGAKLFMANKHGIENMVYSKYIESEFDVQKFIKHCLLGVKELDSLYSGFSSEMLNTEKNQAKKTYLKDWVQRLDSISFSDDSIYHGRFQKKLPNNAFFMTFERYDSKKEDFKFQLESQFRGDLKKFIEFYKMED